MQCCQDAIELSMINKYEPHQGCCLIHSDIHDRFGCLQEHIDMSYAVRVALGRNYINSEHIRGGT